MTRAEIRSLASVWLDDVNNGYFTVAQLDVWINNAQREVQKLLLNASEDYYTVCATASTVVDQARYQFPSDFLKVMRLSYITQGSGDTASYRRLYPITRNQRDLATFNPSGDPSNYYFNKDTLTLIPTPSRALTLHIEYAYRVSDMSNDSDEPDVPEDYHEYLAILSARDGFLRDGRDMGPIQAKLAYFEKMLTENAQQRNQDSPRMVVATSEGFGAGF